MIKRINNTTIKAKLLLPPCPIEITSSSELLQYMLGGVEMKWTNVD